MYEKLWGKVYDAHDGTYSHLVDDYIIAVRQMGKPKARKLLKEMFERMEELLSDDIIERYFYGAIDTEDDKKKVRRKVRKLWEKDIDSFVWLGDLFGFKVNKKEILKNGEKSKQREEIIKLVGESIENIEESLNNYLEENILTQIDGLEPNDLNALSQARNTFLKHITGELP